MTAIDVAYQALLQEFKTNTNFWQVGNAFDTMLDYLVLNPGAAAGIDTLAAERFTVTQAARNWYDDDGWWLIATIKGVQNATVLGWDPSVLEAPLQNVWNRFSENAPYVWANGQADYPSLRPLISGGVWNAGWPTAPFGGVSDPTTDNPPNLAGFQNTVTNALFMVGTQRGVNSTIIPEAAGLADSEYDFLTNWFGTPPNGAASLLKQVAPQALVVRERATAFDSSQQVYGYDPDQAWLGDQGLILGALVARMKVLKGGAYLDALGWAQLILAGVESYLCKDNVLLNWWGKDAPGNDAGDYATGRGVFFRYLLDAWNTNPDLRKSLGGAWPDIIAQTTNAPEPEGISALAAATNRLAALLAAEVIG